MGSPLGPSGPGAGAPAKVQVCELLDATIQCQHGRKPSRDGVLEVVPATIGEQVSLSATTRGGCGKHPEWRIEGILTSKQTGAKASFRALSWDYGRPVWLEAISPQTYRISVSCCQGPTRSFEVRAFPSDKISYTVNGKSWPTIKNQVDFVVDNILGMYLKKPKFEYLEGQAAISALWNEHTDHRAFYKYEGSLGFNPLLGGKFRIPFGPLSTIPQWLKKYGDAYFYVEFSGGIEVNGYWGRQAPDRHGARLDGAGYIRGEIGASLFLIDPDAISAEAAGKTGIALTARNDDQASRPTALLELTWEGIKGRITIEMCWGFVEFEREFNIVEEMLLTKDPWHWPIPLGQSEA